MDWNGKWDLDNLVSFGSKATYVPKKLGFGDLFLMDGEIDTTSPFNLSSGSNGHHASPESSTRDVIQNPSFKLMTSKGSPRNSMTKSVRDDAEITEVVEKEPLIGLKLGKRTYFENTVPVGNAKASSSSTKLSTSNRSRSTYRNSPIPRCIVEGCAIDLSTAKEYHRKHKVCDTHSKSSKVIVGGAERRFCQQCSRFHSLSEFDDMKRSCRRRLFDHNARRRKPQPETMLNSAGPSSPFYVGREQIGFFLTNGSDFNTRNYATTKFTMTRDHSIRCEGDGGIADPTHVPVIKLAGNDAMRIPSGTALFSSKISAPVFWTQVYFNYLMDDSSLYPKEVALNSLLEKSGCKESFITSPPHMEAATEYGRALSLLSRNNSNNSWGSCAIPLPVHCQGLILPPTTEPPVTTIYGLGLGVAEEALPEFLLTGHHHSSAQNTPRELQDQASRSQVLRGPNEPEPGFYQNGPQMTDKTRSQFGFFY